MVHLFASMPETQRPFHWLGRAAGSDWQRLSGMIRNWPYNNPMSGGDRSQIEKVLNKNLDHG
jgi:hypothetical protein